MTGEASFPTEVRRYDFFRSGSDKSVSNEIIDERFEPLC